MIRTTSLVGGGVNFIQVVGNNEDNASAGIDSEDVIAILLVVMFVLMLAGVTAYRKLVQLKSVRSLLPAKCQARAKKPHVPWAASNPVYDVQDKSSAA